MTPKQERFCQLYIELGNASEAYRQAGLDHASGCKRYYTYLLVDPRDEAIFYVGKGTGRRLRQHVTGALNGRIDNPAKCKRIIAITSSGHRVRELLFSDHDDEASALKTERSLIELLKPGLTNITSGCISEAERASIMARQALARMKSFDEWLNTASQKQIDAAERWPGGARVCHDEMRAMFEEYAL